MSKPRTITITLTHRTPVRIDLDAWPLVAREDRHDGEVESQANHVWTLRVRQHADGRAIVYGWEHAGDGGVHHGYEAAEAGELLQAGSDIPAALRRVGEACRCNDIVDACVADLPPVDLE